MALANANLGDSFLPGDTDPNSDAGGIDVTEVIDDLLPSLHAATRADLVFWTEQQLLQWMDEALKRLAAVAAVFVGRQAGLTTPATATMALPPQHVATLQVTVNSQSIRPTTSMEMEARDPGYQTTQGSPDHWYQDLMGDEILALAPVPDSAYAIAQLYEGWPNRLDSQQTMVAGPAPLKGYLAMYVLAEAYGREGEMESADISAHCLARLGMYHQILTRYYGSGN